MPVTRKTTNASAAGTRRRVSARRISPFTELDGEGGIDASSWADRQGHSDSSMRGLIDDAADLAESAGLFFRGLFPVETPHFAWGKAYNLHWHDKYWTPTEDGEKLIARPIAEEIAMLVASLSGRSDEQWGDGIYGSTYHSGDLVKSDQLVMQGLAVEVLLSVDRFLVQLSAGDVLKAVKWLSLAYKNIIECTVQAQQILGYSAVKARGAALARHRENHAMKAQVEAWYAEHRGEFTSMDAAAEAAAGTLVPVTFRTVRAWIGAFNRQQRSARRP